MSRTLSLSASDEAEQQQRRRTRRLAAITTGAAAALAATALAAGQLGVIGLNETTARPINAAGAAGTRGCYRIDGDDEMLGSHRRMIDLGPAVMAGRTDPSIGG